MDTHYSDLEGAPLIDFTQVAQDGPSVADSAQQPPGVQAPTTPERGSFHAPPESPTFPPVRSVRQLVESLGSPVHASPRNSPIGRTSPGPSGSAPSPFEDPASFGEPEPAYDSHFRTSNTRFDPDESPGGGTDFVPFSFELPGGPVESIPNPIPSVDPVPALDLIPEIDPPVTQAPEPKYRRDDTGYLELPYYHPRIPSTTRTRPVHSTPPAFPAWFTHPPPPRPRAPSFPRQSQTVPVPRPLPTAPAWTREILSPPSQTAPDELSRLDRFSRTTAHTAISDVLFNFDLDPSNAADLVADACETARQVGVSTHDLLSRSVFLGTTDLGMTPVCLEASRVDVEGGIELVLWLIENSDPGTVGREVKKGCLMRKCGMGEQSVWNVLRGFLPDVDGFAYDVDVDGLAVVPGAIPVAEETTEDEDDDGSLYDDVSIIDAEFLDQADIETLKSSEDELDKGKAPETNKPAVPSRVHRARIVMPSFKESLLEENGACTYLPLHRFGGEPENIQVLTAEWMFEGRIWALSMGQDSILVTFRQTSELIVSEPVKVTVLVRILPLDIPWSGFREVDHIGSDRLLPTQTPSDILLPSPLYQYEFEEKELVPGPVGIGTNSSVCKTDVRASMFSLLELVGTQSGFKVEVVVRVVEKKDVTEVETGVGEASAGSIPDDASDWQFVDE